MRGAEQIIYLKFGKAGIVEVPVGEGGDKTVGWLKEALAAITKVGSVFACSPARHQGLLPRRSIQTERDAYFHPVGLSEQAEAFGTEGVWLERRRQGER